MSDDSTGSISPTVFQVMDFAAKAKHHSTVAGTF